MKKLILNPIKFQKNFISTTKLIKQQPIDKNIIDRNNNNSLIDKFNRKHSYLRISLTEKCNLRCLFLK